MKAPFYLKKVLKNRHKKTEKSRIGERWEGVLKHSYWLYYMYFYVVSIFIELIHLVADANKHCGHNPVTFFCSDTRLI